MIRTNTKHNPSKNNQLRQFIMDKEIHSSILKALPFHNFSSSPISCKYIFNENESPHIDGNVSCSVVCDVDGDTLVDRSYESTYRKAWKSCIKVIVDQLTTRENEVNSDLKLMKKNKKDRVDMPDTPKKPRRRSILNRQKWRRNLANDSTEALIDRSDFMATDQFGYVEKLRYVYH